MKILYNKCVLRERGKNGNKYTSKEYFNVQTFRVGFIIRKRKKNVNRIVLTPHPSKTLWGTCTSYDPKLLFNHCLNVSLVSVYTTTFH